MTDIVHQVEDWLAEAGEVLDRRVRLGVTGLSRAGKSVFIAALVHHLLHPTRLGRLSVIAEDRFDTALLRPMPGGSVPRFGYEAAMQDLIGSVDRPPRWPDSTRAVSELRLSIRFRSPLMFGFERDRTLHLDIVDYPGEWLLDLPLLGLDYAQWSRQAVAQARTGGRERLAGEWLELVGALDPAGPVDETAVIRAAAAYHAYLQAARHAPERYSVLQPGRFLLPGEMAGAPALTFFPLPDLPARAERGSIARLMADRFESYKREIARPFFEDHLQRIDRQVVLVDLLEHLAAGQESLADLKTAIEGTLGAFRHGEGSWLSLLFGRRISRVLFAATKADHLPAADHAQLAALLEALVGETGRRLSFAGARIRTEALAALRVTQEIEVETPSGRWPGLAGLPLDSDRVEEVLPGSLPASLAEAGGDRLVPVAFRPMPGTVRPDRGPPSLRMDRAVEFLLGDMLA
ncbi:MAG: YcjX family protein [Alphaproteobacteria bacterium]|nr:YcjX family protein [Alphaproteobacteria bacterium]MCB9930690.1 YcjX family protein [Alphaproteobacteria bacterium]